MLSNLDDKRLADFDLRRPCIEDDQYRLKTSRGSERQGFRRLSGITQSIFRSNEVGASPLPRPLNDAVAQPPRVPSHQLVGRGSGRVP